MTAIVHIGLPDAGEIEIQRLFRAAPGVNYLGYRSGDDDLDKQLGNIVQYGDFDPAPLKEPYANALARPGVPVMSNTALSSWRRFIPEENGERLGYFLPRPKVVFIVRRTVDWARARFFDQLIFCQRDTFAGINPWLEKHMSRLRLGSQIAPSRWAETLAGFKRGCGFEEILILPYEMLEQDRAGFIAALEGFTGLEGLAAAGDAAAGELQGVERPERRTDLAMANAYRMLGLRRKEPEAFLEMMALFNRFARKKVQQRFDELKDQPDAADGHWSNWFRTAKAGVAKGIADEDPELMTALNRFNDYEMRDGLRDYLMEIEREETAKLREQYGVDLRPWGYAPPATGRR